MDDLNFEVVGKDVATTGATLGKEVLKNPSWILRSNGRDQ